MDKNKPHNNKTGYSVPKNYFGTFEDSLFSKLDLKEEDHSIGNKSTGFKAPEAYLESFEADLFEKLNIQPNNQIIQTTSGYKMPDSYLDKLEEDILKKVNQPKKTKLITLFSRKDLLKVASIAAIFVIGFFSIKNIFNSNKKLTFDSIEYADFEEYINEKGLGLSEYEIANLYNVSTADLEEISINNDIDENQLFDYLSDELTTDDYIDNL
ncbi:hypothetical protein [Pseudofulvibacter geojedonensis]|uniref:Uncharacterized protein n=1 Tax=Pseudofulvibacter geojedonensis TaxID=1123758 RepID=A0ABW3HZ52_9FLAO